MNTNAMKNSVIKFECSLPKWGDSSVEVKNLRQSGAGLIPSGIPAVECKAHGDRMIGTAWGSVMFLDGRRVLWVNGEGAPEVAGILPGDYRCHVASDDGVLFMTDCGAWRLKRGSAGEWLVDDYTASYPKIRIGVYGVREFSASTSSRELSGEYRHWAGPLEERDTRRATSDILAAYSRAVSLGLASGYYTQPVAVWYRLLGSRGEVLYRSEPVVVSDGGYRGEDAWWGDVGLSGGVYRDLGAVQVKLRGFALGYEADAASGMAKSVASAEIYVSPLIDPVDYAGEVAAVFGAHDATSARLGFRLPLLAGLEERARRLLDRLDAVGKRVAVVQNPFSGTGGGMTLLDGCAVIDPAKESAALSAALRKSVAAERSLIAEITQPHRFSAGVAGVCSDMVVWGDLKPLSALPAGVWVNRADSLKSSGWSSVTRVTIDGDGEEEILSLTESGSSDAPASLGPVVGYCDPRAKRIQVVVTYSDGTRRGVDLQLTPTPDGSGAFYVSAHLAPVALAEGVQALSPVTVRRKTEYSGGLAVALTGNELVPVATAVVSSGQIKAIAESTRYGNSLDMGRRHIAVFTTGGIHVAGVNPDRGAISCHCIDAAGVERGEAVAAGGAGIYAASAGRLLLVDGSRVKIVARGCDFIALGYSGRYGELLCLDAAGRLWAVDEDGRVAQRELPQRAAGLCCRGCRVWVIGESDVYDLDREEEGAVAVRYSRIMRRSGVRGLPGVSRAVWLMSCAEYRGTLTVKSSNTGIDEVTVAAFRVNGRINLPPHTPMLACRYRCVRVTIEGEMSTDGVINEIIIE